jgi:hypothetical protein
MRRKASIENIKPVNMKLAIVIFFSSLTLCLYGQVPKANLPLGSINKIGEGLSKTEIGDFFPVHADGASAEVLNEQFQELLNCPALIPPVGIAGLTSGWRLDSYQLTVAAALSVGVISAGEASTNQGKEIHVYDFMYVKDDRDCSNNLVTWGAGVRLVITVKKLDVSISVSGLAAFAASAQLQKAEVSVKMEVVGLSGSKIAAAAPSAGPYDVVRHSEFMTAIDKIKQLAYDSSTTVTPQKISMQIIDTYIFMQALIFNHAIVNIVNKKNYEYALSKLKTPSLQNVELLKGAYKTLVGRADGTDISQLEALNVREYLRKADIID